MQAAPRWAQEAPRWAKAAPQVDADSPQVGAGSPEVDTDIPEVGAQAAPRWVKVRIQWAFSGTTFFKEGTVRDLILHLGKSFPRSQPMPEHVGQRLEEESSSARHLPVISGPESCPSVPSAVQTHMYHTYPSHHTLLSTRPDILPLWLDVQGNKNPRANVAPLHRHGLGPGTRV